MALVALRRKRFWNAILLKGVAKAWFADELLVGEALEEGNQLSYASLIISCPMGVHHLPRLASHASPLTHHLLRIIPPLPLNIYDILVFCVGVINMQQCPAGLLT